MDTRRIQSGMEDTTMENTMRETKCWKVEYAVYSFFFQTDIIFRTVIIADTEEAAREMTLKGNRLAEKINVLPGGSLDEARAWVKAK